MHTASRSITRPLLRYHSSGSSTVSASPGLRASPDESSFTSSLKSNASAFLLKLKPKQFFSRKKTRSMKVYISSPIVSQEFLPSTSDDTDLSRVVLSPMSFYSGWDEHNSVPSLSLDSNDLPYGIGICRPSDEEVYGIWPFAFDPITSPTIDHSLSGIKTHVNDLTCALNIALPEDSDSDFPPLVPANIPLTEDDDDDLLRITPTDVPLLADDEQDFPALFECPSPRLFEAPTTPCLPLEEPTPTFGRAHRFLSTCPYVTECDLGRVLLALTHPVHDIEHVFPLYDLLVKHDRSLFLSFLLRLYFLCANTLSLSYTSSIFPPSRLNGPGLWGGILTLLHHDGHYPNLDSLWGEDCSVFFQVAETTARRAFDLHFRRLGWLIYLWVAIRTSFFHPRLWETPTTLDYVHHPALRPMFPAVFDKDWQMPDRLSRFGFIRGLTKTINWARFDSTGVIVSRRFRVLVGIVVGWGVLTLFALVMCLIEHLS